MRTVEEIMQDIKIAEDDLAACQEAGFSTECAVEDLRELRKELREAQRDESRKAKVDYAFTVMGGADINDVLNRLRKSVAEHTEKGYALLGGASIACDNGMFYVMQTLTKEVN